MTNYEQGATFVESTCYFVWCNFKEVGSLILTID